MEKNLKKIAETTLNILSKKTWPAISCLEVKKKSKIKIFDTKIKNKIDLLKNINYYFDFLLTLEAKNIENSNNKDMIFEILMIRFDILENNRKAIISISRSFKHKPKELIFLLPSLIDSIILMLKYTNISIKGIMGQIKIKSILIIYILTFLVWLKDESLSLEKTMNSLDQYLNQAGKFLAFIE